MVNSKQAHESGSVSYDFDKTLNLVEKTFTRQVWLQTSKQCKSFLANDKNGDSIAVTYMVWDKERSYYLLGGYDQSKSHHGASALAMWEAIKFTKEELGLREFDFEGSMIPQVEQFFRKFGGKQTPYYTVSWVKPYLNIPRFVSKLGNFILSR